MSTDLSDVFEGATPDSPARVGLDRGKRAGMSPGKQPKAAPRPTSGTAANIQRLTP
jgi:hypothetical protein